MIFHETKLKDCYLIEQDYFGDQRGWFSPYYIQEQINQSPITFEKIVQCNRSKSIKNVARGFHYQKPPKTQAKIVEVVAGAALDIVIDLRQDSPTFKQYICIPLSQDDHNALYVPKGFAHGFISLDDNTIFQYLVDNNYAPELEDGIPLDDDSINIDWEEIKTVFNVGDLILSEKDALHQPLKEKELIF